MSRPEEDAPSVSFLCPACSSEVRACSATTRCESCDAGIHLRDDVELAPDRPLTRCAICNVEAMYIAKDFNKNLGVAIVALGCIGFYWGPIVGISTLVVLTALDRVVYHLRPVVTVCYACKAVYRGAALNPQHQGYDLTYDETFEGTGEPLRFERAAAPAREPS